LTFSSFSCSFAGGVINFAPFDVKMSSRIFYGKMSVVICQW
jgi:hypothetical protein